MEKAGEEAEDLGSCPDTQQLWDHGQTSSKLEDISGTQFWAPCPLLLLIV